MPSNNTAIPSRLGRYEILDRLAVGGMAEIFLATEHGVAGLERLVVIKRILPHLAADDDFVQMFLQEARFIARVNHPNVVQIHELAESDGAYFIVMEYIEGSSVRDLMAQASRRGQSLDAGAAIAIICQACAGAHAAHELKNSAGEPLGLVHRDISPHNLMVNAAGHVKLLDFGIAKSTTSGVDLTRTGGLKGKLNYLSPEQCEHQKLDRRSDVFALGVVLWEMLAGQRLFKRDSELATMQAIVDGARPDLAQRRPELHPSIIAAINQALAVDRERRTPSAWQLRQKLQAAGEAMEIDCGTDHLGEVVRKLCGDAQARTRQSINSLLNKSTGLDASVRQQAGEGTTGSMPLWKTLTGSISLPRSQSGTPSSTLTVARAQSARASTVWVRRALVLSLSMVVGLTALWWARGPAPVELHGATIRIGFAPSLERNLLRRELEPLRSYLQNNSHRPFAFVFPSSYGELAQALIDGEVDFAFLPPNLYIETHAREPQVQPRIIARYGGGMGNDGILLVRESSPIRSIQDLRGKKLCFPDPESTTGFVLPRAALRKAGVDPDRDLAGVHYSGNHLQAIADCAAGICDAVGTYSNAYRTADLAGVSVTTLRVLAITGRAPHDTLCSGPKSSASDLALVTRLLLAFDPRRELDAAWLGAVQRITQFSPAADSAYDALRLAIADERHRLAGGKEDASTQKDGAAPQKTVR